VVRGSAEEIKIKITNKNYTIVAATNFNFPFYFNSIKWNHRKELFTDDQPGFSKLHNVALQHLVHAGHSHSMSSARPAGVRRVWFVRWADEIVINLHGHDKTALLATARPTRRWTRGPSFNPVLALFQHVVHRYGIDRGLLICFCTAWRSICATSTTIWP
jgi:hypothetical protein